MLIIAAAKMELYGGHIEIILIIENTKIDLYGGQVDRRLILHFILQLCK